MVDTTIVGENIELVQGSDQRAWNPVSWTAISWSAVIAGALTAIAVAIMVIALGSGIGLSLASPYSYSPSAGTLTIMGAVWLVLAQGIGYATGGFVAGRLRRDPALAHNSEIKFRDGANGLIVWAIGVVLSAIVLAGTADLVGGTAARSASAAGTAIAGMAGSSDQSQTIDYFTDMLLRTNPQAQASVNGTAPTGTAPTGAAPNNNNTAPNNTALRNQIRWIMVTAVAQNGLSADDRAYLAQIVSAQTGMSMDNAQHRVDDVVNRARQEISQATDTTRKAGAYLSFWTFMSLLFGAVCATLGGILGGDLRDEVTAHYRASMAAR